MANLYRLVQQDCKEKAEMGKSLNYIGKKAGRLEQLQSARKQKLEKKEDYKKFYDSYQVENTPADWSCSACDDYYYKVCEDSEIHEKEWETKARELNRDDIYREYKKAGVVENSKNKVGYKVARKCFLDDYYGDFKLALK